MSATPIAGSEKHQCNSADGPLDRRTHGWLKAYPEVESRSLLQVRARPGSRTHMAPLRLKRHHRAAAPGMEAGAARNASLTRPRRSPLLNAARVPSQEDT